MGRTKPCLEEQRKPLSLSLSLFLVESSVDSQSGAYCASRESFARQIDIFRGTLVCAQEEEEHGVCTRSRRLARRSWDSWKLRERRTEETPQSAFPEKLESSPLRGAATWAEEVEKSPRFFTLWKEKGIGEGRRKRWRGGEVVWDSPPRGGRARAFETRFSSPIHLFLSSTPIEKRCSRARLSEEWIPSMKRFLLRDEEKKFHFLIHALCNRAVWKSDGGVGGSILSPRLLRVLFSRIFVEISREEKSKYIIEIGGI